MKQIRHLDHFLRGRFISHLECRRNPLDVTQELGIIQSGISRLWQRFQDDGNVSRRYTTDRSQVTTPKDDRFSLQSDSRRTFIRRAPGTQYHQENIIKRHFLVVQDYPLGDYSGFQNLPACLNWNPNRPNLCRRHFETTCTSVSWLYGY
ncbi:uncharacterized protein TNCV_4315461 [Trichonephila clavipes]|nr:uncharacterized protein TNCV_4315461 [Trichonephila clavipes]